MVAASEGQQDHDLRPKTSTKTLAALCHLLDTSEPEHDAKITGITHDSRRVHRGDLYAALPGSNFHGAQFAMQAVAAGANVILTDAAGIKLIRELAQLDALEISIPVIVVPDPRAILGEVAAWIYDYPARDLVMIGITGTDGKTTTAMLIEGALNRLGISTGLVGTIATRLGDWSIPSARTTPEASDLQALLALMRERGAKAAVLEVSSHALELGRVEPIVFDLAIFTNLGLDHLDFHGTQAAYFAAKAKLFTPARAKYAIICANDNWGVRLLNSVTIPAVAYVVAGLQETTWGNNSTAEGARTWVADKLELSPAGWLFKLRPTSTSAAGVARVTASDTTGYRAGTSLLGRYNVANATGAIAAVAKVFALLSNPTGITQSELEQVVAAVAQSPGAPGRMELVNHGEITMLVDYAHTPDAVKSALMNVGDLVKASGGKVIVVLGCGGDRDPSKRPTMGQIAVQNADIVIVTDDNPRSENPTTIRQQILAGIAHLKTPYRATRLEEIGDRRQAATLAVTLAQPGDVVIALGKGHETGQEINGEIFPMDDRELLAQAASGQV